MDQFDVVRQLYPEHFEIIESYRKVLNGLPAQPIIIAEDESTKNILILDGNHTSMAMYMNHLNGTSFPPIPVVMIHGPHLSEISGDMALVNRALE